MSISKKTERMDIFVDEGKKSILVQERWQYNWLSDLSPWTMKEKRKFHELIDNIVWKKWGGFYKLKVKGKSDFAKRHKDTIFVVNFDIKWVSDNPHWFVNVKKIAPGGFEKSSIDWNTRVINLDTEDTKIVTRVRNGVKYQQLPVAHMFGRTLGNISNLKLPRSESYQTDYSLNPGFKSDYYSIINIGEQLRLRHIDYVLIQLNSDLVNTIFYFL
ncbi:hypothetical protein O2K51_01275 [Apibacter raozihei]|uniref:hypothetical protein n=1 Tax=Apibacter TaxID=1778601 RepID=UPI000FE42A7F|nr:MULTISPECIES: hypothetical protein [Apibacter]